MMADAVFIASFSADIHRTSEVNRLWQYQIAQIPYLPSGLWIMWVGIINKVSTVIIIRVFPAFWLPWPRPVIMGEICYNISQWENTLSVSRCGGEEIAAKMTVSNTWKNIIVVDASLCSGRDYSGVDFVIPGPTEIITGNKKRWYLPRTETTRCLPFLLKRSASRLCTH